MSDQIHCPGEDAGRNGAIALPAQGAASMPPYSVALSQALSSKLASVQPACSVVLTSHSLLLPIRAPLGRRMSMKAPPGTPVSEARMAMTSPGWMTRSRNSASRQSLSVSTSSPLM